MTKRPSEDGLEELLPNKATCLKALSAEDSSRFSPHQISYLLKLIHDHRCLWDYDNCDFGNIVKTDLAWKIIAEGIKVEESQIRSLWNTVWNTCALTTVDRNPIWTQLSMMSHVTRSQTVQRFEIKNITPSKRAFKKKVSWSRFDYFNLSGHIFVLPRRFACVEIIKAGPSKIICSAADLKTEENVIIRKASIRDASQCVREYWNLSMCRLLSHTNIMSTIDAFEVEGDLYTVTEFMDGRLTDIIDEHLNHFVIARIIYQLLSALQQLHSNDLYHGNITLNSVYVNTDATLKLSSYGEITEMKPSDDKFKEDVKSIGFIMSRLLLEENSFLKLSEIRSGKDVEWRPILQGNIDSGLIDFHARNMLYLLLDGRSNLSDLLQHPYLLTFRRNERVSKLNIGIERRNFSQKSYTEVHKLLREELNYFNISTTVENWTT